MGRCWGESLRFVGGERETAGSTGGRLNSAETSSHCTFICTQHRQVCHLLGSYKSCEAMSALGGRDWCYVHRAPWAAHAVGLHTGDGCSNRQMILVSIAFISPAPAWSARLGGFAQGLGWGLSLLAVLHQPNLVCSGVSEL